jgi:type III secretory pathway component EscV
MSSAIKRGLVAAAIAGGIALFAGMPLLAPVAMVLIGGAAWAREARKKDKRATDDAKKGQGADGNTLQRGDVSEHQATAQATAAGPSVIVANSMGGGGIASTQPGDDGAPRRIPALPDVSPAGPGRSG